jgi:hypothetical protein
MNFKYIFRNIICTTILQSKWFISLQVDKQKVEGGLLRHINGYSWKSMGSCHVPKCWFHRSGTPTFRLIAHRTQSSHSALHFSSRLTSIVEVDLEIFFSQADIWGEKQIFMNVYLKCWSEHGKIWNWRNHFILQVVELDFLYPSEGIHQRWDNGYRITATAATLDQAAFILSIPRRKPNDETQETLRTSAFPSQHVKVTWQFLLIV